MARARFIRPEFFTDDKISGLSMEARILFISIWCQCDLRGVFEWNPRVLRVLTFPHDLAIDLPRVVVFLEELTGLRMVIPFEVDGKQWGFVRKFSAYQTCPTSEKKNGTLRPAPPLTLVRPKSDYSQTQVVPLTLSPTPSVSPTQTQTLTPSPTPENKTAPCSGPLGGAMQGRGKPKDPIIESGEAELARKIALARAMQAEREKDWEADPTTAETITEKTA